MTYAFLSVLSLPLFFYFLLSGTGRQDSARNVSGNVLSSSMASATWCKAMWQRDAVVICRWVSEVSLFRQWIERERAAEREGERILRNMCELCKRSEFKFRSASLQFSNTKANRKRKDTRKWDSYRRVCWTVIYPPNMQLLCLVYFLLHTYKNC